MKKILVVDDDVLIRTLVKRELEKQGFSIDVASDGTAAWSKLERTSPDLVITDINMPNMGGLELLKKVRGDSRYQSLPMLCITGESSATAKQKAIALGATGWVQKPFNPDTWGETLKKILS
ncbi:MAG: response regulator [Gammaproteobacteria bacterium]|jgi:two-component system chemotaxis response regulator CheY|nr:response regulator [Gammaproteobacteria bacterium]MBT4605683.1 response regulator [Thiotrichales bacterium]MBT3472031.1 response regulator [Gammaproteobacteria bacterium]MBT3968463.1 response regulator [Gammaproteobacteria bacterium]MBT4079963.1 response regulator [Gammaproteobacteria bacterium]